MLGLMFLAALVAWLVVAIRLARWISQRPQVKPSLRSLTSVILAVLIFFLPVADEFAARPYFGMLCHKGAVFRVDKQRIKGRRVTVTAPLMNARVNGAILPTLHSHYTYVDATFGDVLAEYETYAAEGGALARALGVAHSHPLTGTFYCAPEGLDLAPEQYGFVMVN